MPSLSVLAQKGVEFEYIIVDSGSTDGSREIIERYRNVFAHVILESDAGPADGLNKGFERAGGDVYCYLNSDDEFMLGAFARVASFFTIHSATDVVFGHTWVVDAYGNKLRRVWSDPYNRILVAYGAAIQMQPSTFLRAEAFRRIGGFNVFNRISWDGEHLADLALSGARMEVLDAFLSLYRLHANSITGAALHKEQAAEQFRIQFKKLMRRPWSRRDRFISVVMFLVRQVRNPAAFFERLTRGKVYGRVFT